MLIITLVILTISNPIDPLINLFYIYIYYCIKTHLPLYQNYLWIIINNYLEFKINENEQQTNMFQQNETK